MMREHSPAPWRAYLVAGLASVVDKDGNQICSFTRKENADLIAAAPNLLHACEVAYESWARGTPMPGVDLCALLGQALDKAKGKS